MPYEAATFRELQERLRCNQIWIVGAAAIAAATDAHGEGGSKMRGAGMAAALLPRTRNCLLARLDDGGAGGIPGHVRAGS